VLNGAVDPHEDGLPKPTPELLVMTALIGALLRSMPPKKRQRLMERMGHNLETGAAHAGITRLHRAPHDRQVATAHGQAVAWWRSLAGVLSMVGED
jgi:hypothetical protein